MPLFIVKNDLTKMKVDAIVNAANNTLLGGGGVDGCIHRAAGKELLAECRKLGGCATGAAKLTGAYNLPCKYIIHTVGPRWLDGKHDEEEKLISCYQESLKLAAKHHFQTVAFPLIAAGAYGYPRAQALKIAIETIASFLLTEEMTVYLVIFKKEDFQIAEKLREAVNNYLYQRYRALSNTAEKKVPFCIEDLNPATRNKSEVRSSSLGQIKDAESFTEMVLRKLKESALTQAECCHKANTGRKLFAAVCADKFYQPSKPTAMALAIALELSISETKELLKKAGYTLSTDDKSDLIAEFFINKADYNIFTINAVLFAFDCTLLGDSVIR